MRVWIGIGPVRVHPGRIMDLRLLSPIGFPSDANAKQTEWAEEGRRFGPGAGAPAVPEAPQRGAAPDLPRNREAEETLRGPTRIHHRRSVGGRYRGVRGE